MLFTPTGVKVSLQYTQIRLLVQQLAQKEVERIWDAFHTKVPIAKGIRNLNFNKLYNVFQIVCDHFRYLLPCLAQLVCALYYNHGERISSQILELYCWDTHYQS